MECKTECALSLYSIIFSRDKAFARRRASSHIRSRQPNFMENNFANNAN